MLSNHLLFFADIRHPQERNWMVHCTLRGINPDVSISFWDFGVNLIKLIFRVCCCCSFSLKRAAAWWIDPTLCSSFMNLYTFFFIIACEENKYWTYPALYTCEKRGVGLCRKRGVLGLIMLVDVLRHLGCAIMRYTGERAILLLQGSFSWWIPKLIRLLPVERETDYVGSLRQEQFGEIAKRSLREWILIFCELLVAFPSIKLQIFYFSFEGTFLKKKKNASAWIR